MSFQTPLTCFLKQNKKGEFVKIAEGLKLSFFGGGEKMQKLHKSIR